MIYWMFLLLFPLLAAQEPPNGFSSELSIAEEAISLHENLQIVLTLTHPQNYTIDRGRLRANLLRNNDPAPSPFLLVDEKIETPTPEKTTITYTLEPQRTGRFHLTFWDIGFLPKDEGSLTELISEIIPVNVLMPARTDAEPLPAPIMDLSLEIPVEINYENRQMMRDTTGLAKENLETIESRTIPWEKLLGIFLFASLLFWAMRQAPKIRTEPKKGLPEIQREAKERLQQIPMPPNEPVEDFYVRLTDTIRQYFENRFDLHAPTQTTEEFLHHTAQFSVLGPDQRSQLENFMKKADKVKFAKDEASVKECEDAYRSAREVIESSNPTAPK